MPLLAVITTIGLQGMFWAEPPAGKAAHTATYFVKVQCSDLAH
jgi:hypothetical protein